MKKKNKTFKAARRRFWFWLAVVLALFAAALIAPHFLKHDPYEVNLLQTTKAPGNGYLMGTDYLGRCIFCRLLKGAARSVFSALAVVAVTFVVGTAIGCICGYAGGWFDTIVMRFVDAVQAFPELVFTISVAAMLGSGMGNCIIAMSAIGWTSYARLARSQVLQIKEKTYVSCARISGAGKRNILFRTILPNSMTPLVVQASMHVGNAILGFSGLSFLGLGTAPPYPEWGTMLNDGKQSFQMAPWTILFPGLAIFLVVMIMGMFGDSVNGLIGLQRDLSEEP